ncbi:ABC transporter ATP-binding protein [Spirochaeta africana]|uniref:ABC-type multidrug transport system, ATPase component n=1 Tax=Spirochaeta africana (strain ATCC 700263 / DSM 8902 / Z-7692) TaxID=889378 RepID=H9ULM0_SPIAZ|nr:ABC transporter ATP-binding protein [Spirochaeta africana]AFG38413.1 ABC-type multidrug transport system, ATPase component [Spirochaeta africana DSM 8902]
MKNHDHDPTEPVIQARHVYKSYGELQAVQDLSFTVAKSRCYGFLGPNGAGKTSTMKMIYGKATRDNRSDTVFRVFGCDPAISELAIKQLSGVVIQDNSLDEELNVRQNLRIFSRFYGLPRHTAEQRIDELLEFMELSHKAEVQIKKLSGGMQRRLSIARALLNDPQLLILDEPTTGLDPQVRHLIWNKLRELKQRGVTILLTTHYMEEAFQICDEILIMDRGRKILEGRPQQLLQDHMERYVLEAMIPDAAAGTPVTADTRAAADTPAATGTHPTAGTHAATSEAGELRSEDHNGMRFFYANDMTQLESHASRLGQERVYIRQANLEDLFLKFTGRGLNELQ